MSITLHQPSSFTPTRQQIQLPFFPASTGSHLSFWSERWKQWRKHQQQARCAAVEHFCLGESSGLKYLSGRSLHLYTQLLAEVRFKRWGTQPRGVYCCSKSALLNVVPSRGPDLCWLSLWAIHTWGCWLNEIYPLMDRKSGRSLGPGEENWKSRLWVATVMNNPWAHVDKCVISDCLHLSALAIWMSSSKN